MMMSKTSDQRELYMPAHELITGDLIVYENQILEIGRFKQHARFYTNESHAQTPIIELWKPGHVEGAPIAEVHFPCIDTMVRVHSVRRAPSDS